jgi:hypothetical protein
MGSGCDDASRKASCTERRPSRRGRAWESLISGAAAVTSPAKALINLRASSKSICEGSPGSSAKPHLIAAALMRLTATSTMTSTAGTSAMSRVARLMASVSVRSLTCSSSAMLERVSRHLPWNESGVFIIPPALAAVSRLPGSCTPPTGLPGGRKGAAFGFRPHVSCSK